MAILNELLNGGQSVTTGITAKAGGGQATATVLTSTINVIGTCATIGDSVMLPPSIAGAVVVVANDGAASATVYGQLGTSDTINGVATGTGVALAATKRGIYVCTVTGTATVAGKWVLVLTA